MFGFCWNCLKLSVPEKLKNSIFEIAIIPEAFNIGNCCWKLGQYYDPQSGLQGAQGLNGKRNIITGGYYERIMSNKYGRFFNN